jgi:dolichol-phosphate mannosyltransferase
VAYFRPPNGYTAIHRTALQALNLRYVHPRYFFESSMLIQLRRVNAVVEDVPMPARYGDERSSLSLTRTLIEFPWLLLRHGLSRILWQYFVADFNAVLLYLLTGVPMVAFGLVFGIYHWVESYRANLVATTGTVMLGGVAVHSGLAASAAGSDTGHPERAAGALQVRLRKRPFRDPTEDHDHTRSSAG